MKSKPTFERLADLSLRRVRQTYARRGIEYGDSLRDNQWLQMQAVARELGVKVDRRFLRALAMAALCDVKYQRAQGGYKDDSGIDGIAYMAVLLEEMREIKAEE